MIDSYTFVADAAPPSYPEPERRAVNEEAWNLPHGSAGVTVNERTALQLPSFLSVLNVLSSDVAVLPIGVYQRDRTGGRIRKPEHPVDRMFTVSPNDGESTPVAWKAALMSHALTYGNGYAEIQRTGRGAAYAMHLLDPESTTPERYKVTNPDGSISSKLRYRVGSKFLLPENVFHLAGLGGDGLCGYNFVRLLRQAIGLGMAPETYAADYFANKAEPGGVIEVPQRLNEDAADRLASTFGAKHGPGRRHKVAVLEQGAKWNQTTVDPEKSQLTETRKFQVLDVARAWRVPPHKIGDFSQSHLANIEASNLDYLMTALMFWLTSLEQQGNLKLLSDAERAAGYYVEHNVNALLRGDIVSRFNAYHQALTDGWLNRDEIRSRENLSPIGEDGGGAKYLVQLNQTTLERIGDDESNEDPETPETPETPAAPGEGEEE